MIATATELFSARHFSGVVAVCSDALDEEPEHLGLLMLRARAHIALRRDLLAQADLRDLIRIDPTCALAYRLLGELSARRDQHESAAIFFRESLRLEPGDRATMDWLSIVDPGFVPPAPRLARGTAPPSADQLPTAPFPRRPRTVAPIEPAPVALDADTGEDTGDDTEAEAPDARIIAEAARDAAEAAFEPPPLAPASATLDHADAWPGAVPPPPRGMVKRIATPLPVPPPSRRPATRGGVPELAGFDEYLVAAGVLSRGGLRAAQTYQRSMHVALSAAIVALGLATPQRVEWAAVSHQSQLAQKQRRPQQP